MTGAQQYLIVGGDSFVGRSTAAALVARGYRVYATTRRPEAVSEERPLFDFESPDTFVAPEGTDYAFVIAAATQCGSRGARHRPLR